MNTSKQYLSIVTDYIQALKARNTNMIHSNLRREFIESRIHYFQQLINLPLLINIKNMSEEDFKVIEQQYGYDKDHAQTFLIQLFDLEKLDQFIQQSKVVSLEYIKTEILKDFDTMATLIELQNRNLEYENKKQKLYGPNSNNEVSYTQLYHKEQQLIRYEEKIEKAILSATKDYDIKTLKELHAYQTDRKKSLSLEFILKHKDKIENPKMKKLTNRLTRKGFLGAIDKFLPFRKKREQVFLDTILESYKSSSALSTLGITEQDITNMNAHQLKSLTKRIQKQSTYHRNKIAQTKDKIKTAKTLILKQIKEYEELQEQDKRKFMEILSTKIDYLPKMFQEQIWNEPNLKESLMRLACYQDEKRFIERLSSISQNKVETLIQLSSEKQKTLVKTAA